MKLLWKHKTRFKNRKFFGNQEYMKNGEREFKFVDVITGRESKAYSSHEAAKKDGWIHA